MERIVFFNSKDKTIAKVDNVSDMDWVTIFDHLTEAELHAIKLAYVEFCDEHITYEDIADNNEFEEYLCDDSMAAGGFYFYEEVKEVEEKRVKEQALTIRQLYEMAKKENALDIPINWFFTCDDDWYSKENEPLKKSEVDITETEVNFYL